MSADYTRILDRARRILLYVEFTTERRDVVDYAVVLTIDVDGELETVRLYDGAHDENELHRHGREAGKEPAERHGREAGKEPAEIFHRGTLGEGMRAAIEDVENGYQAMIEAWEQQ